MFDRSPHPIWTFDRKTLAFLAVNKETISHYGYSREEFLGMTLKDIVLEDDLPGVLQMLSRLFRDADSGTPRLRGVHRSRRKDGTIIEVDATWSPVLFQGREAVLALVLDVETERALKLSEQRFSKIFRACPAAIGMVTIKDGRLIDVNDRYLEMFGYRRDEMVGRTAVELGLWVDPGQRTRVIGALRQSGSVRDVHARLRRKAGEIFDALLSMETIDLQEEPEPVLVSMITDVTDRRRAEEERARFLGSERAARADAEGAAARLQALSRRLVETQEVERRRIARELHDEVGQLLTGLRLLLVNERRGGKARSRSGNRKRMMDILTDLTGRVRTLSMNLRPAMLDDLGLVPALRWHFERYTDQTRVRVDFSQAGVERRFPPEVETAAFRIIQEALTNVARHAGVAGVKVDLRAADGHLEILIEDKGTGFDVGAALSGPSSGLAGMRERAHLLGGILAIESAPGDRGTRLMAELPAGAAARTAAPAEYPPPIRARSGPGPRTRRRSRSRSIPPRP
jgi:PAS domain S-box-containing protein